MKATPARARLIRGQDAARPPIVAALAVDRPRRANNEARGVSIAEVPPSVPNARLAG